MIKSLDKSPNINGESSHDIPLWTGVFLLLNTIVGGGIVDIPLAYYNLGVATGIYMFKRSIH